MINKEILNLFKISSDKAVEVMASTGSSSNIDAKSTINVFEKAYSNIINSTTNIFKLPFTTSGKFIICVVVIGGCVYIGVKGTKKALTMYKRIKGIYSEMSDINYGKEEE